MGAHINSNGEFQSDKYPTCPPGKVPLSVKDKTAQALLWAYAQRRRSVDAEFSDDLETCLVAAGFKRPSTLQRIRLWLVALLAALGACSSVGSVPPIDAGACYDITGAVLPNGTPCGDNGACDAGKCEGESQ